MLELWTVPLILNIFNYINISSISGETFRNNCVDVSTFVFVFLISFSLEHHCVA